MNKQTCMTAAFLVSAAGLLVTAAMSLPGGGEGPQLAPGIDMKVSSLVAVAVSSGTGNPPTISAPPAIDSNSLTVNTSSTYLPTIPAGAFALAMQTVSCNAGTNNEGWVIPFSGVPDYRHMYIATSFYRWNANGRLEQLSVGWVKHSFSSASQNQVAVTGPNGSEACGNGANCATSGNGGGTGSKMGWNCADVYWSGLNAGNTRLGPRFEIIPNDPYVSPTSFGTDSDPYTVAASLPSNRDSVGWRPRGSFFDNYTQTAGSDVLATAGNQNDNSMTYSAGSGSLAKRNVVLNTEVEGANINTDRQVIMECYYILNGDFNKFNNIAWRQFRMSGSAPYGVTAFSYNGMHTYGPPLIAWANQTGANFSGAYATTTPTTFDIPGQANAPIGTAYVGCRVTSLGGGMYKYDYNIYNVDIDRGIVSFDVPIPFGVDPSNVEFRQPREWTLGQLDKSDWQYTYDMSKKSGKWTATPVAGNFWGLPGTNALRYGTMYTYSMTLPLKPRSGGAAELGLGPSRIGATGNTGIPNTDALTKVTALTMVPRNPADVATAGTGAAQPDGFITGEDFDLFIQGFFNSDASIADIVSAGSGQLPGDGFVTGEDFDAFIQFYFNG